MISTLCFLVVNLTLTIMLANILRNKQNIGSDFLLCLLFTFLGNLALGITANTIIALLNVVIGLKVVKR